MVYNADVDRNTYELLKQQIKATCRKDLDALERVWAMAQKLPKQPHDTGRTAEGIAAIVEAIDASDDADDGVSDLDGLPKGAVMKAVSEILPSMPVSFTWMDVEKKLRDQTGIAYKSSSVRQALMKLHRANSVDIVENGRGRMPTVFKMPY